MWWFYTVVLGMSFGQILQELAVAVREWAQTRDRRPFLPAMLWQVFLLVLVVEVWLAVTYYRRTFVQISVVELLAFLIVPAGILVMSFLLPVTQPDGDGPAPQQAFDRVRPVFFGVLTGIVAINLVHGFLIGQQGLDIDLVFQCLIMAGALTGLALRSTTADVVLAAAMIAVLGLYIGLEYSTVLVEG
jgi:hypothetical protein